MCPPGSQTPADQEPADSRVLQWLFLPTDAASLAFFRIAFGSVILWHVYEYCSAGWVDFYFTQPPYHLTYFGFEWVTPLPGSAMRLLFYAMGLAALGVLLGLCYRFCSIVLFVTFTYSFLAEAAMFQNHYYLTSLLAFLLCLIPANQSFSLDSLRIKKSGLAPAWCRRILAFQIAVPYVFGGITKINDDWIHAKPVGMWLAERSTLPWIGPYLTEPMCVQFISWFGICFDLAIVPLILWKRTRVLAYVVAVCFHVANSFLFSIGYFPWFMILATPILFSPDWPRRLLGLPPVEIPDAVRKENSSLSTRRRLTFGVLAIYVTWQVIFPFRYTMYPGNPSWTEQGQQFAWRMMLRRKEVWIRFYATETNSGETIEFPITLFLNGKQIHELAVSADQIVAAAHFFADQSRRRGIDNVEIRVVALVSLNGRKPQLMVDPELDLTTVSRTWGHQPWIVPLTEPLRENPWTMDSGRWPEALGIKLPVTQNYGRPPHVTR